MWQTQKEAKFGFLSPQTLILLFIYFFIFGFPLSQIFSFFKSQSCTKVLFPPDGSQPNEPHSANLETLNLGYGTQPKPRTEAFKVNARPPSAIDLTLTGGFVSGNRQTAERTLNSKEKVED